jgi:hypothetical protein
MLVAQGRTLSTAAIGVGTSHLPLSPSTGPRTFGPVHQQTFSGASETTGPVSFTSPSVTAAPPERIAFKVLRVENPPGTRDILLRFERDTDYGLGLEVSQSMTASPDGKLPDTGYRDWQQKMWLGLNGARVLQWTLPEGFTAAEISDVVKVVDQRARTATLLPDGAMPEFANVRHKDGWTYTLLARVRREPGAPHPPAPPGALFTVERKIVVPGDATARVRLGETDKGGNKRRLEDLLFRTASNRATGFVLRWQAYPEKHPQHPNGVLLDLVDADTGVIFHRMEHGFAVPVRLTSRETSAQPPQNGDVVLAEPGTFATVNLVHAEQATAPGVAITDWWDLEAELRFVSPTEQGAVPAFQLPPLPKSFLPDPGTSPKADLPSTRHD